MFAQGLEEREWIGFSSCETEAPKGGAASYRRAPELPELHGEGRAVWGSGRMSPSLGAAVPLSASLMQDNCGGAACAPASVWPVVEPGAERVLDRRLTSVLHSAQSLSMFPAS